MLVVNILVSTRRANVWTSRKLRAIKVVEREASSVERHT